MPPFGRSVDSGPLDVLTDASNTTLTLAGLGAVTTVELTQLDRKLLVAAFRAFRDHVGSLKLEVAAPLHLSFSGMCSCGQV